MQNQTSGNEMYEWAKHLFPICRSITGQGVRDTLLFIRSLVPETKIYGVPSGTRVFDWVVPDEWSIKDAFIADDKGEKIVDFNHNNLHVVGYSEPQDCCLTLNELRRHLYTLPNSPNAIPYVTSYYQKNWGFCLSHNLLKSMPENNYRVFIDSELKPGVLNYGEIILPGKTEEEIFFSTYICHPSMANHELSGPVLAIALAKAISLISDRRYTYRIVFIPETIGSIVYLSKNLTTLKKRVIAAFNLTCVGDDRTFSFLESRLGDTLADRIALYTLQTSGKVFQKYSYLERGSDERQYCWPGVDLPMVSIMRSKYGTYPEYHTSDDNLNLISPKGLEGALEMHCKCVLALEENAIYISQTVCEPNLGKRGLYPKISTLENKDYSKSLLTILSYCDGFNDLLSIAIRVALPIDTLTQMVRVLVNEGLIKRVSNFPR